MGLRDGNASDDEEAKYGAVDRRNKIEKRHAGSGKKRFTALNKEIKENGFALMVDEFLASVNKKASTDSFAVWKPQSSSSSATTPVPPTTMSHVQTQFKMESVNSQPFVPVSTTASAAAPAGGALKQEAAPNPFETAMTVSSFTEFTPSAPSFKPTMNPAA